METEEMVVDGCVYEVEYTHCSMYNIDRIVIWTKSEELVADIKIDHNTESAMVTYQVGEDGSEESSYPYFDIDLNTKREELARWMVATHPGG